MEITWNSENESPYLGDLSDFNNWKYVTHIRIGFDEFEWVKFIKRNVQNNTIYHSPSTQNTTSICPEDIWGLRIR